MKNRTPLYWRKIKTFLAEKLTYPLVIHVDHPGLLRFKNEWELRKSIRSLHYDNRVLKKEIKQLKVIIELRNMEISLNKGKFDL